jgi:phosphoglycolate phosphatase-like HAD superfamily hydrolase
MTSASPVEAVRRAIRSSQRIVFDFDGTLVDSNEIKWKGFEHVFAEHQDRMEEIRAYCRRFNHTIRGDKFQHVSENILGLPYTPELAVQCHRRYEDFTTRGVALAKEIPGAASFVRSVVKYHPSLLSSTPHDILLQILDLRGWGSLFGEIRGAPVNKAEWLVDLQLELNCAPQEVLFFGDTDEDAGSAQTSRCTFVRVGRTGRPLELAIPDFSVLVS